ncbi:MAG TPA: hypothetical protein VMU43_10350 [Candidatus Acidoferrum sp.]|nr:hypothetical protein [Candidatus Acidoferrum sp.]
MSKNFELLQQAGWDEGIFRKAPPVPEPDPVVPPAAPSVVPKRRRPSYTELRLFVHAVFLDAVPTHPRTVVFTGLRRRVGCSSVCAAVTKILAEETQQSVCAVDGNSLSPSLHLHFGASNQTGLTDALHLAQSPESFVQRLSGDNHWFLAHGQSKQGRHPAAASLDWGLWIRGLRNRFDFVLVDAPPLNASKEAIRLAGSCDGLIVVADSSEVLASDLCNAKHQLQAARVPLLGFVMTQASDLTPNLFARLFQ